MTSRLRRGAKFAFFAVLGIFLGWQVVQRSVVGFLASVRPEWAIQISPSDPVALAASADREFLAAAAEHAAEVKKAAAAGQSAPIPFPKARLVAIRDLAERALATDPLNTRMLAILGSLTDEQGDKDKARALMTLAAKLTRQETMALLWLLNDAFQTRSFDAAAGFADAVLRTRPNAVPLVAPVLARMAEDISGAAHVQRLLATAPPWRLQFFNQIAQEPGDPLTPMLLLLALKASANPATSAEYAPYLRSLMASKRYANAYYTWLQSLTDEQLSSLRLVYNGGFESQPSGAPFDWSVRVGAGVAIEFSEPPDAIGSAALRVNLGHGRIEFGSVEQTLMLAPGRYQLALKLRGNLAGKRGLRWQVMCLDGSTEPLAETPSFLGVARNWQDISIAFDVPQQGCSAQRLALGLAARSASEQLVTGQVWYDDIRVERIATPQ